MDNENVIIKLNIKFPGLKVIGNWNEGPAESVIDFINSNFFFRLETDYIT